MAARKTARVGRKVGSVGGGRATERPCSGRPWPEAAADGKLASSMGPPAGAWAAEAAADSEPGGLQGCLAAPVAQRSLTACSAGRMRASKRKNCVAPRPGGARALWPVGRPTDASKTYTAGVRCEIGQCHDGPCARGRGRTGGGTLPTVLSRLRGHAIMGLHLGFNGPALRYLVHRTAELHDISPVRLSVEKCSAGSARVRSREP